MLAVAWCTAIATPSQAESETATDAAPVGTLTTRDGVAYLSCFRHSFTYSVEPAPEPWVLEVSVLNSKGKEVEYVSIPNATTGAAWLNFCLDDIVPGGYRIVGVRDWLEMHIIPRVEGPTGYSALGHTWVRTQ